MARERSQAYLRLLTIDGLLARGGASPVARAAVEGNWDVEDGGTYSPTDDNAATGTMGIAQWQGARKQRLIAWARARGENPNNLRVQVAFALSELRSDGILARLNRQTNVTKAARIVQADYEVSDPATLALRQSDARKRLAAIADAAGGGGVAASSSTGSVVQLAEAQIGKPYRWDTPINVRTKAPKSFDCSGLSEWCFWHAGVRPGLPHNAAAQYVATKHRPLSKAQPGDLVFLSVTRVGALAHHVMIYAGDGQVIEAPDYGIPVRKRALSANEAGLVKKVGYLPGSSSGGAQGVTQGSGSSIGPDPSTLPAKLSAARRTQLIGLMLIWRQTGLSGVPGAATLRGYTDAQLKQAYTWAWELKVGSSAPITNPKKAITDKLDETASGWVQDAVSASIKLAFAAGGIAVVALGINRAAKGTSA